MAVVNPNPNQFRVMDFGAAMQAGQDITYNRARNEAIGMEIEEAKRMRDNRARADEIRQQIAQVPGQVDALRQAGLHDQADELAESYVSQQIQGIQFIKEARNGINAENYDEVRAQAIQTGEIPAALWPVEYDENWFREQEAGQRSALSRLTRKWSDEDGVVWSQDVVSRGGVIDLSLTGEPYRASADRESGDADVPRVTSAESGRIADLVERSFSGRHDPYTGALTFMEPETEASVLQVSNTASRLVLEARQQGQEITFEAAVQRAMDLFANDPQGIR